MIKLIVTDMDGTLLNSKKEISSNMYQLIDELTNNGILFCLASGRALHNVINTFHGNKDKLLFVGDNGGSIRLPNKSISTCISKHIIHEVISLCGQHGFWVSMNSDYYTYVTHDCDERYIELLKHYGVEIKQIENLHEIEDSIVKITICDLKGSKENIYPVFEQLKSKCNVVVSGDIWLDISHMDVNKAFALTKIMEYYGIHKDEVVAFGDYNNDVQLVKAAGYGIAVKNAVDEVKAVAAKISAYTNDEDAVFHELQQLFKEKKTCS